MCLLSSGSIASQNPESEERILSMKQLRDGQEKERHWGIILVRTSDSWLSRKFTLTIVGICLLALFVAAGYVYPAPVSQALFIGGLAVIFFLFVLPVVFATMVQVKSTNRQKGIAAKMAFHVTINGGTILLSTFCYLLWRAYGPFQHGDFVTAAFYGGTAVFCGVFLVFYMRIHKSQVSGG